MSLINNMLQDLDRRRALGPDAETAGVRAPAEKPKRREWFWYTVAGLMIVSLAWVGWVVFQIMPRPLIVTKPVISTAEQAPARPQPVAEAAPPPVQPAVPQPPPPAPVAPEPVAPQPVTPAPSPARVSDTLRLAREIETPLREEAPKLPPQAARPAKLQPPKENSAKATAIGAVDKFERTQSTPGSNHFARAVTLLNQGRVAEAERHLATALQADPSHAAARQAYVALLLEQQRGDAARRLLQEGLALAPEHPEFALTLARMHTERREYAAALQVLDRAGDAAAGTQFQALRGAVLQRLGKHAEAVDAYQNALRSNAQPATTWLGLAISLEALGLRPEASQAYRRALSAGPLAAEAREYAEARARAVQ